MNGVHLDHYIFIEDEKDLDLNKFMDEYLSFIESKGYISGGSSYACDENGDKVLKCIKCETVNFESCSRCNEKKLKGD